jgi:methylthioribose-1-phosphate isomerase
VRTMDGTGTCRTIWWDGDAVAVLDQTCLPDEVVIVLWRTVQDAARGIETMQVRGAPLIGVAASHGIALALGADPTDEGLDAALSRLAATRPTAVNLRWALNRCATHLGPLAPAERGVAARCLATRLADEDAAVGRALAEAGLPLLAPRTPDQPVHVMTHCNAGRLAAVAWGTALAPIYLAHDQGRPVHVWVSETRPRNQGAALTAWELAEAGVPHTVIADNGAGHALSTGLVDVCLVGADRVAANGDVVNKVGTYLKALAARDSGVPFYVVAPVSTVDHDTPDGAAVPIEERDVGELIALAGRRLTPAGTAARNWAFDVTPARLISGIVTERGIVSADPAGISRLR